MTWGGWTQLLIEQDEALGLILARMPSVAGRTPPKAAAAPLRWRC